MVTESMKSFDKVIADLYSLKW